MEYFTSIIVSNHDFCPFFSKSRSLWLLINQPMLLPLMASYTPHRWRLPSHKLLWPLSMQPMAPSCPSKMSYKASAKPWISSKLLSMPPLRHLLLLKINRSQRPLTSQSNRLLQRPSLLSLMSLPSLTPCQDFPPVCSTKSTRHCSRR